MVLVLSPCGFPLPNGGGPPCAAMTPKDPELGPGEKNLFDLPGTPGKSPQYPGGGTGQEPGDAAGFGTREAVPGPAAGSPLDAASAEAVYERVSGLLERGRYRDAENLLSRGLEIYPESVDLLKELGVLYHLQGRYAKAARTFSRVMNITGDGKQSLSWKIASLSHKALEEFGGPDPGLSLATFDQNPRARAVGHGSHGR